MRFIIIALLFFISIDGISQDMEIGVKSGINFAYQTTSQSLPFSRDYLVGFHGGIYFSKMFNKHSGLQMETIYSVQGHQESGGGLDLVLRNNYINIPLLYKYKLNDKFSFYAGPQFGILVRATLTFTPSGSGSTSLDVKDQFHAFDWGIAAGATYELGKNFNLSLRYTQGITTINKNDTDYTSVNTNLQISAGYRLPFFKKAN